MLAVRLFGAYGLLIAALGCAAFRSGPEVRTALTAGRAASLGLLELIDYIEGNGGSQEKANKARQALHERDYGKSLAASYLGVEEMRANGAVVPQQIDRALYMVRGAAAAQAFDDLSKAMRSTLDD